MTIHITPKKGTAVILSNTFPAEAATKRVLTAMIFIAFVFFIGFSVFPLLAEIDTDFFLLMIVLVFLGFTFSFINSSGGEAADIEIDENLDLIKVGDKEFQLSLTRFSYSTRNYNNPLTRRYFDREVIDITLRQGDLVHVFTSTVSTFIVIKEGLQDTLGVRTADQ